MDQRGHVAHGEGLGELVEHPELARGGRVLEGQGDAGQGVSDIEHAPGLSAGPVDRQRMAHHRLHAEAVEHGAEHAVVVESGGEHRVEVGLRR